MISPTFNKARTKASRNSRFTALVADDSAVTAIEFALLLPTFVGLIFFIAQVGLYFMYSTALYYATEKATRQIMTGSVANQGLTAAQFRTNVLCPLLPFGLSCSNVITNVQVVPDSSGGASYWYGLTNYAASGSDPRGYTVSGLNNPPMNNAQTSFCLGAPGAIIAAQVYYAMPVLGLSQLLPNASNYNGQFVIFISATSVLKNEPFYTSYSGC